VKFSTGQDEASIAFNVCDLAKRTGHDGSEVFANMLVGTSTAGQWKHLTSDNMLDVEVELLCKNL